MRLAQRLRRFIIFFAILGFILSITPTAGGNELSEDYDNLFLIVTILSALVAVLVVGMWVYFMKTFSENNEVERVPFSHETSRKLEVTWTVVAIVIVILLMLVSYPVLFELDDSANNLKPDRTVYVKAREWSWTFTYQNGTDWVDTTSDTPNPILKAGLNYEFIITSVGSYIHSFFVPDLHFKMDAIPGENNTIVISIGDPGTYDILCAEYCGVNHSLMRFNSLIVNP